MNLTKQALLDLNPCAESRKFIASHKTLRQMWAKCERPDWMLWALKKFDLLDDRTARIFAVACRQSRRRERQDAARSARSAAESAWSAWSAARSAENGWQADKLRSLINPFAKKRKPEFKAGMTRAAEIIHTRAGGPLHGTRYANLMSTREIIRNRHYQGVCSA